MCYRPGAQLIHKVFWSVAGDRWKERRREEAAEYVAAQEEEETP
jgi:hypothetical protein